MKTLLKLSAYALCISLCFYTGCASNDEPEPFDCDTSDLDISVSASTDPTTCLAADGSITVLATGGEEPYQYKLGAGSFGSSNIFDDLGAGVFIVTVKDKNGCTAEVSETLELPGLDPLTATANTTEDTECLTNNGSITVDASGGTPPYEYKLDGSAFVLTEVFNTVGTGSHLITVKDADGCAITVNVNVPRGNTGTTYTADILPIFEAKCLLSGCHLNNDNGHGNWGVYSTAFNKRNEIKSRTQSGDMPRTGSLTANQKALIACWVDDGAPN